MCSFSPRVATSAGRRSLACSLLRPGWGGWPGVRFPGLEGGEPGFGSRGVVAAVSEGSLWSFAEWLAGLELWEIP